MNPTVERRNAFALLVVVLPLLALLAGCGSSGDGGGQGGAAGTNRARFTYEVDLQGDMATMVMEVEIVNTTGITWGPGVTPEITGVLATGSYTVYTAGELRSSTAYYVFTGENQFADFVEPATSGRFRVQWVETPNGLLMVVNPFGPMPVTYDCVLVGAEPI